MLPYIITGVLSAIAGGAVTFIGNKLITAKLAAAVTLAADIKKL